MTIHTDGTYSASWASPSFPGVAATPTGAPGIVRYLARVTGPSVNHMFEAGGNTVTGSGLVAGKTYTFTIAAQGVAGSSTRDPAFIGLSPAAVITATAPILPGNTNQCDSYPNRSRLTTSWYVPGGVVIPSSYTVNLPSRQNVVEQTTTVPNPTATFHGLTPGVDYHLSVQANNQFGSGAAAISGTAQAPNRTWTQCATEHGTCVIGSMPQLVDYHPINAPTLSVPDYYKIATSYLNLGCNNDVFGDPYVGLDKVCLMTALINIPNSPDDTLGLPNKLSQTEQGLPDVPGEWTYCATEGGYCYLNGRSVYVAFGAYGSFKWITTSTKGTNCTNAVFTDPAVGRYKVCFFKPVTP